MRRVKTHPDICHDLIIAKKLMILLFPAEYQTPWAEEKNDLALKLTITVINPTTVTELMGINKEETSGVSWPVNA